MRVCSLMTHLFVGIKLIIIHTQNMKILSQILPSIMIITSIYKCKKKGLLIQTTSIMTLSHSYASMIKLGVKIAILQPHQFPFLSLKGHVSKVSKLISSTSLLTCVKLSSSIMLFHLSKWQWIQYIL